MELCRIILVDDHSLFRSGMRGLLDRYDGIRVVGEASTGEEFLAMLPATEADVVLMDDDPLKIAKAIKISRKCIRIVHENIVFSLGVKLLCLLLVALGFANMWMGIFADVGVMVLAVLNAIRALRVHNL